MIYLGLEFLNSIESNVIREVIRTFVIGSKLSQWSIRYSIFTCDVILYIRHILHNVSTNTWQTLKQKSQTSKFQVLTSCKKMKNTTATKNKENQDKEVNMIFFLLWKKMRLRECAYTLAIGVMVRMIDLFVSISTSN